VPSCPEVAADGEVILLVVAAKALVSSGHEGFEISREVFQAEGLKGLSMFGDSLSSGRFFACETEWIS
jgi:hypothetical protein